MGFVTSMSVQCERDVYTFELETTSHSYQMDIKVKRRSYQDIHRTYDDLVTTIPVERNEASNYIS